jgi:hypothetical protein
MERREQILDKFTKVIRDTKMRILGFRYFKDEKAADLQEYVTAQPTEESRGLYRRVMTRAEKIADDFCLPFNYIRLENAYDSKGNRIPNMKSVFIKR